MAGSGFIAVALNLKTPSIGISFGFLETLNQSE
jgi:hypothetical protein